MSVWSSLYNQWSYLLAHPFARRPAFFNTIQNFFKKSDPFQIVDFHNRTTSDKALAIQRPYEELLECENVASYGSAINPFFYDFNRVKTSHYYRRLKDVSQFQLGNDEGLQTRGSHVGHVEVVAREIALGMGLSRESEMLAATVASIHDIGHPPFAHDGEQAFQAIMKKYGETGHDGWDHDMVGLKIVTQIANLGLSFPGMNLCLDVLEGLAKRYWRFTDDPQQVKQDAKMWRDRKTLPGEFLRIANHHKMTLTNHNHIEGQIASIADWLAFTVTDIEDGLKLGIYDFNELGKHCPLAADVWRDMRTEFQQMLQEEKTHDTENGPVHTREYSREKSLQFKQSPGNRFSAFVHTFARAMQARLVNDVLEQTSANIGAAKADGKLKNASDVRNLDGLLVDFSPNIKVSLASFQKYCHEHAWEKVKERYGLDPQIMITTLFEDIYTGNHRMEGDWDEDFRQITETIDAKKNSEENTKDWQTYKHARTQKAEMICEYITAYYTDNKVAAYIHKHYTVENGTLVRKLIESDPSVLLTSHEDVAQETARDPGALVPLTPPCPPDQHHRRARNPNYRTEERHPERPDGFGTFAEALRAPPASAKGRTP